jgi:hypothetical protein
MKGCSVAYHSHVERFSGGRDGGESMEERL